MRDLIDTQVIPAYRGFEAATRGLSETVDAACASGSLATDAVFGAFADAWITWAGARHVVKGPITYFDRQFRVQFWPDTRNRTGRELAALRAAGGTPAIAEASVAVQGFPALERVIHAGRGTNDCPIAQAIAANLHTIAAEVVSAWTEGDTPFRATLVAPGATTAVYSSHAESLTALMTGAVSSLEGIVRLRLARPLGDSLAVARPKRAEAWRSGLSMDLIRADIAAVAASYGGDGSSVDHALRHRGEVELADLMARAFRLTGQTARAVTLPLAEAVSDPEQRAHLEELAIQVSALKALLTQRVGPALGISAGFNSLDGD